MPVFQIAQKKKKPEKKAVKPETKTEKKDVNHG